MRKLKQTVIMLSPESAKQKLQQTTFKFLLLSFQENKA